MQETTIAGGAITNWLAIIGVVSLIYWAVRLGAALVRRGVADPVPQQPVAPGPAPVAVAAANTQGPGDDIAAIAAAVYAVLGADRIVHLEAEGHDQNWAVEGRWMQQTSHRTRA